MSEPVSEPVQPVSEPVPVPQGRYVPAVVHDGIVHSAGMTPRRDGTLVLTGRVGDEITVDRAAWAAGLAAGTALRAVADAAGGMHRIARCLRMTVYVRCAEGFTALSAVADGASARLVERLGEGALPVRAAVGVRQLPGGAPVEVDLTVALLPDGDAATAPDRRP